MEPLAHRVPPTQFVVMTDGLAAQVEALSNSAGVFVPDVAPVRLTGDDALEWLQGQITQDVRGMVPGDARYGLLLTGTGKVQADMHVLATGEGFVLLLPPDAQEAALEQMDRYIVMEDVDLEPVPVASLGIVALGGPHALAMARDLRAAGASVFEVDLVGSGGAVALGASPAVDAERLATLGLRVSAEAVEVVRVRNGLPRFGKDFGLNTLPQVAGVKARAVSFDKGCYLGQEPVVMLEHRGKPPKRLARVVVDDAAVDAETLVGGTLVDAEGQSLGALTSATGLPGEKARALGFVKRGRALEDVAGIRVDGAADAVAARAIDYVES